MNAFFAAGLFDSPWVIVAFIVISGIANWLSKRRQQKQAEPPPKRDETSPSAGQPSGEFDLEEVLRRLMGEEALPKSPVPPRLPRASRSEVPPIQTWPEVAPLSPELARPSALPAVPVFRPASAFPLASVTARSTSKEVEQAERRFEQLSKQGRHPATVVTHKHQAVSRSGRRRAGSWRDPRSLRHAFVASLVFAPPKSFEP